MNDTNKTEQIAEVVLQLIRAFPDKTFIYAYNNKALVIEGDK